MRIVNLGSGSKGNSTFICAGQARVLIDVGFSVQEIARRLEIIGEKPEDIDAVIVTHEHVDHIRGFITFLKKYKARGYVPEEIYEEVLEKAPEEVKNKVAEVEPELASCMVRECVYRGFCPEMYSCGYVKTEQFKKELDEYRKGFDQYENN